MNHLLENVFMSRELYQTILKPVCDKYQLTNTELMILLFLANNPEYDTASAIVEKRRLTKSSISMAIRTLQDRGLVVGAFHGGNRRSIHLKVCDAADTIIEDGRKAQESFSEILVDGFSEGEKEALKQYFIRVTANIDAYNKKTRK
ncbi:MAG: helix-turn-helix domain-containing protein [Oscillospiraceae bacterium]|nr:helix-turn-helix domain-containing protein [Oscillospiraceae bacterium]